MKNEQTGYIHKYVNCMYNTPASVTTNTHAFECMYINTEDFRNNIDFVCNK